MTDDEVTRALKKFVEERDWNKFHSIENLAKSISIEAGELLEVFQWGEPADEDRVIEELADVLTYCYLLAIKMGKSPHEVILEKLKATELKYPIEKARGKNTKYDRL